MSVIQSRLKTFIILTLSFFLTGISAYAQDEIAGCQVERNALNDVLDTRFGQSLEYSQSVTTGVSFLLNEDCGSALTYFKSAYAILPTPAVSKVIAKLGGSTSDVKPAVAEKPAASASVPEETSIISEGSSEVASEKTEPEAAPVIADNKTFTNEELDAFKSKGLEKVKRLTEFLNMLCQKSTPSSTAISTVNSALDLFDSEDHTVEVSSVNHPEKSRFPVRTYLNRLRMLNYSRVEINGAGFTYVSSFRKGPDGNYYGIARFRQTFTGYVDKRPTYSDVTTKTVTIVLKPYQKAVEGSSVESWDVFLGDIMVAQTERN
ncbi:MAG: hypothetical protein ACKO1U_06190 [Bacteroidota bacterium]